MAEENKTEMSDFEHKVTDLLNQVRGALQNDGGDLELVSIVGKTVTVRLKGHCGCCPHAMATLKGYVEATLRDLVDPEIVVERADFE